MKYFIPRVSKTVCITDNLEIATNFSLLNNKKKQYLPIIEGPRIVRPDASNEAIKINNALAQVQPNKIIYGKLENEATELLNRRFAKQLVREVNSLPKLSQESNKKLSSLKGELKWGFKNLGVGLLKALKQGKSLVLDENLEQTTNFFRGNSRLLIVAEDRADITSIIIANYAFAFDASLLFINSPTRNFIDNLNDQFFRIYEPGIIVNEELTKLKRRIIDLMPEIDLSEFYCITFFTGGIPYGYAYSELPTSHIYNFPMLGANLCNYIAIEQNNNSVSKVGLIIDPGDFEKSESSIFIEKLSSKNTIVRLLANNEATVNNAGLSLAAYPADIILISSHADEVKGYRVTYNYYDSENIERELVVDEAVGFGWDPQIGMFQVTTFTRFVYLDGVDWTDEKAKSKLYVGTAILHFSELGNSRKLKDYETKREKIPKVHLAMAYKMSDGIFIPMLQGLAAEKSPIFISNACSSWRKVSTDAIVAGARIYIGPIRDILNSEAIDFIKVLMEKHIQRPICFGVWRTQKELYPDDIRRPYLLAGTHFTKFNFSKSFSYDYLKNELLQKALGRMKRATTAQEEDISKNSERFSIFLMEELEKLKSKK